MRQRKIGVELERFSESMNCVLILFGNSYEVEPSDKPLSTPDIAAKAREFTVRVECWK